VAPASSERTTVPPSPTATAVVADAKAIEWSVRGASATRVHEAAPSVVR
jgi:hypothetical protein